MTKKFLNDGRDFRYHEKVRSILDSRQLIFKKIYYVTYYTGLCWHSKSLRTLRFHTQKIEWKLGKVLYTYFQIVFSISGFIISSLILSLKTKSDFFANGKIKAEISFAGNLFGTCALFIYMLYHCVKTEKYLIFNTCYIILVSKF